MHCEFETAQAVIDKIREMGFEARETEAIHAIECTCGAHFEMQTCLVHCPECQQVYGVTPCHSTDSSHIVKGE